MAATLMTILTPNRHLLICNFWGYEKKACYNPMSLSLKLQRTPWTTTSDACESRPRPNTRLHVLQMEDGPGGAITLEPMEFDVVVIGAGIIGLAIANRILTESNLSVAVIDAAQPCAGATGAGQGYIWMGHRSPGSKTWDLAKRSKHLWEQFVAELSSSGADPLCAIGWQNSGSLLVASSVEQAHGLQSHVEELAAAGVEAHYLTASALGKVEPSLAVGKDCGAAFVPSDSQIDAALAVALLRQESRGLLEEDGGIEIGRVQKNMAFQEQGRFKELLHSPVQRLFRSLVDGQIEAVQTSTHQIHCQEAVVMAAGAWSASLLEGAAQEWGLPVIPPVRPRKGHLLVVEGLQHLELKHGLMEFEYTTNYGKLLGPQPSQMPGLQTAMEANAVAGGADEEFGVAMTASMDTSGRLLLGSSREFTGFDKSHQNGALECMLKRASKFLPALAEASSQKALQMGIVRTGLRPYVSGLVPLIGPVPGLPGLLLATGHEGSGLCLAFGTAEIVVAMLMGKELPIGSDAYSPAGRLTF